MIYLNSEHIKQIGINWLDIKNVIENAIDLLSNNDFSQPIKPYLRYKNPANRIIAMPAYIGGRFNMSGIKWIASFPGNIAMGKARANSVTILNDAETGIPVAIINTALISGIRTSGVSCYILDALLNNTQSKMSTFNVGIIGFGPIGQLHLDMLLEIFGTRIETVLIYDLAPIDPLTIQRYNDKVKIVLTGSWEAVHNNTDIFITCTVSKERYISAPAKKGNIYLNVSLRDFADSFMQTIDQHIVDNWEEVCREHTDIELAYKHGILQKENVWEINNSCIHDISLTLNQSIMFSPMGMAIFDIAVATHYVEQAKSVGINIELPD
jgi:ornithine cyclodeaminase